MNTLYLLSVDPSIGKIDKHSLSQQTLMELFSGGIIDYQRIITNGDPNGTKDLSNWKKVIFNKDNEIVKIRWASLALQGSIELQWLPLSLRFAFLSFNKLTGTVDLTCLPDPLTNLYLQHNQFHGTVNLRWLPVKMKVLQLNHNSFFGETDFSQLPKSIKRLEVSETQLEGEIMDFSGTALTDNSNVKEIRKY